MKRAFCCFFVFAACTASSPSLATTPATVINCPERVCPTQNCPAATCPKKICPACPALPAKPKPQDWHCFDLHRSKGQISGYCAESKTDCENDRVRSRALKQGRPDPCTTQVEAYCVEILNSDQMYRQLMCARTLQNCESRRKYLKNMPDSGSSTFSPCRALRNIERYKPGKYQE